MDSRDQRGEAVWEAFFIRYPVTERGRILPATAEPAIIEDKPLDPEISRLRSELNETGFIEVEIASFPSIEMYRSGDRSAETSHIIMPNV